MAKYDPEQPRAPAGTPEGGRWVAAGRTAARFAGFAARRAPVIGPALLLYDFWSQYNWPGRRAVVEFPAREFAVADDGSSAAVRQLAGEEVDAFCPRYEEVQERTDSIAETVRRERRNFRRAKQARTSTGGSGRMWKDSAIRISGRRFPSSGP